MIHFPNIPGTGIDLGNPVADVALNEGLVAWWLYTPGAAARGGNRFLDLCGKHHGTLTNGPTWGGALGRPGGHGALTFDGTNDYVDIAGTTSSTFMLLQPFTMACWYRYTGATSLEFVMSIGRDFRPIGFRTRTLGADVDLIRDTAIVTTSGLSLGNAWHHLAGTYDGTNITLYLDGASQGSAASGSASDAAPVTWKIGSNAVAGTTFQGQIDDVRVYTRALSASEVLALYHDSRQGYPTTLNRIRLPVLGEAAAPGGGTILPFVMQHMYSGAA